MLERSLAGPASQCGTCWSASVCKFQPTMPVAVTWWLILERIWYPLQVWVGEGLHRRFCVLRLEGAFGGICREWVFEIPRRKFASRVDVWRGEIVLFAVVEFVSSCLALKLRIRSFVCFAVHCILHYYATLYPRYAAPSAFGTAGPEAISSCLRSR
jgi:hypothetical protein